MSTILDKWRSLYPVANTAAEVIKEFENKYAEISLPVTVQGNPSFSITLYKGNITIDEDGREPILARDSSVLRKIQVAAKLPILERQLESCLDAILTKVLPASRATEIESSGG